MTENEAREAVQKYLDNGRIASSATKAFTSPKVPHIWFVEVVPPYGGTPYDPDRIRTAPVSVLMVYTNGEIQPLAIPGLGL